MDEQLGYQGQLNKAGRQPDLFDELRGAQNRFANACRAFQDAANERSTAEKILQEISQKVAQVMQMALQDPTVPQAATGCAIPGNGRY